MFQCINCQADVPQLVRVEKDLKVVENCAQCGLIADRYIEYDDVHMCLGLILLHDSAWRHALHNTRRTFVTLAFVVLSACLLESFATHILDMPGTTGGSYNYYSSQMISDFFDYTASSISRAAETSSDAQSPFQAVAATASERSLPTLQLVRLLAPLDERGGVKCEENTSSQPPLPACAEVKPYRWLTLFVHSLLESMFVCLVAVWGCTLCATRPKDYTIYIKAVAISYGPKLFYTFFMVWDVPVYFVMLVDMSHILWLFVAIECSGGATLFGTTQTIVTALGARTAFRAATRWCPPFLVMAVFKTLQGAH